MPRRVTAAIALATSVLGLVAPPASAAVTGQCQYIWDPIEGDEIWGWVMSDSPATSQLSVHCEVRTWSRGTIYSTPEGSSPLSGFAYTSGEPEAEDDGGEMICTVWTGSESGEHCAGIVKVP